MPPSNICTETASQIYLERTTHACAAMLWRSVERTYWCYPTKATLLPCNAVQARLWLRKRKAYTHGEWATRIYMYIYMFRGRAWLFAWPPICVACLTSASLLLCCFILIQRRCTGILQDSGRVHGRRSDRDNNDCSTPVLKHVGADN